MQKHLPLLIAALLSLPAHAEFQTWTSADGRKAELELFNVKEVDGQKVGEFRMRNGRSLSLKASDLVASDAKRLDDFQPPAAGGAAAPAAGKPSVFDDVLSGNLVILDGKSFKPYKEQPHPKKYFIFYYTASWCGPCQAFSPQLVEFYNKNKNENFELVLITADRDENAMEAYAVKKHMPWPQLKMKAVPKFEAVAQHGVSGIPTVVVCDLEGKIITKTQSIPELEKLVK